MPRKFHRIPGLYPLKRDPTKKRLFGIDVETSEDNQRFLCAAVIGEGYSKTFYSRQELQDELASNRIFQRAFICATSLMFDFYALFPDIPKTHDKFQIIERNGDLVFCKTYVPASPDGSFIHPERIRDLDGEYEPLTFIDSLAHYKSSVESLGRVIQIPKIDHPSFLGSTPKTRAEWAELVIYNARDAEITFKFMSWLQEWYNNLGAELKPTISGSAIDYFRRNCLGGFWMQPPREIIKASYPAYYGGRSEAFRRGLFSADNWGMLRTYDINSLYPAAMRSHHYPIPYEFSQKEKISSNDIEAAMGTAWFELNAPKDLQIPIIPVKTDKLRFPTGLIRGWYDFATIRAAQDHGYEVIQAKNGIVYPHCYKPFKNFVDSLYKKRQEMKSAGNPAEIIPKILMASLYGKWGYNFSNKEMIMAPEPAAAQAARGATIIPIGDDLFRVITGETGRIPSYVFPIFSIYTTAYARLMMWDKFRQLGSEHLFYTDTDSILTDHHISTSSELGDLKEEEIWHDLCLIKPKFYAGLTNDGKSIIKIKGMHRICPDFADFMHRISAGSFTGSSMHFRKLRGSLLPGRLMNEPFMMEKSYDLDDNKRLWDQPHFSLQPQQSQPICLDGDSYAKPKPLPARRGAAIICSAKVIIKKM